MPSEMYHERVAAALLTLVRKINGAPTYHFRSQKAARVDGFVESDFEIVYAEQGSTDAIFMIRSSPATSREATSGELEEEAIFWIIGAQQFQRAEGRDPWDETDTKAINETIIARLIRDIQVVILTDINLGGLVENTEVISKKFDEYLQGWAVALVEVRCRYTYQKADP